MRKTGWKLSEETKEKLRQQKLGEKNPMYGKPPVFYADTIEKIRRHLPMPEKCQMCNKVPPYDLANITGIYDRDFRNWKYFCRKCHQISDGRHQAFVEMGRARRKDKNGKYQEKRLYAKK